MSSPSKRRESDLMKLMMSGYEVVMGAEDSASEFFVKMKGPADSPYEGGVWKLRVELPVGYPFKSPSIGFQNRIFHPNVDEMSGSVCLDVINQKWSPMFDLVNVFEVFMPQLLLYPNPTDPLNGDAAALLMRQPQKYDEVVRDYVQRYATPQAVEALESGRPDDAAMTTQGGDEDDADSDLSELSAASSLEMSE